MISSFYCPSRILVGTGVHRNLAAEVQKAGARRVFMTIDRALVAAPFVKATLADLEAAGIATAIFSEIEPDPSDVTVEKAFALCNAHHADLIIAIGGGSTMDVGKAVAILATNGGRIHDYEGIDVYKTPPLTLFALPTTAGTGSEVSGSCVITDTTRHLKMSIRHAALNPARIAFLDPIAISTVPQHVAMHSGVDAFVHAFESYVSRLANPVTDALNLQAMELIFNNIQTYVADRTNAEAGSAMLVGSALAGMAFGLTGLGNVHCMARFVGAFFHVSHGLSNALCLAKVAEFNRPAAQKKFARMAAILAPDARGSEEELSKVTVAAIQKLCRDLSVPPNLREIGADIDKLDEMAALCVAAGYERWNPRQTTQADFRQMFAEIY